jgi:hypothetical protein
MVESFTGVGADELILKPREAVFYKVTGAALVEEGRGAGQWKSHSHGFSIPVGSVHGRSIRYRVGQTRGHLVQGAPASTAIDRGTVYITNQRLVFQGR